MNADNPLVTAILLALAALILFVADKISNSGPAHYPKRSEYPASEPPDQINDSIYVRYKDGHGEFLTGEKLDAHVRSIPEDVQDLIREVGLENWPKWCQDHGAVFETDSLGRITQMLVDTPEAVEHSYHRRHIEPDRIDPR